ncbi:MAG: family 16 glycoside hydrolase, partial [Rhodopirellula sp. JB044]|uniref:family 16 glycoside hydrolase n=1 Tax=Rhodopirellula sp. JB044 TaxID=3342844 RepID=UPI00370BAFC5
MENWAVVDGAAELVSAAGYRNVHLLTHQLTNPAGSFRMQAAVSEVQHGDVDSSVGFLIGVRSELNELKSNCFAANNGPRKTKRAGGAIASGPVVAGVRDGELFINDSAVKFAGDVALDDVTIEVTGTPKGDNVELTLNAFDSQQTSVGSMTALVKPEVLLGNVAIGCNLFSNYRVRKGMSRYRISQWNVSGDAFSVDLDAAWGPILWTMYSLSDSRSDEGFVLKLTALTPPLGDDDSDEVRLEVQRDGQWQSIADAKLDHDAWTGTFRIANWDASADMPFRVVYQQSYRDGEPSLHEWAGTIKANPTGRPLKFAGLTCQHDSGFPYAPVAENLMRLDADLLYFSGDQLYEGNGGYGIIREPAEKAIVNYLRKFYMFGWAFGEPMRHSPTLCLPDDHDVFQGNIWGEGGEPMDMSDGKDHGASSKGGYREPVRMVNAVHRTCVGHHPEPFDPSPAAQGMSVYFGDMVYGDVSFAIVADRQFKSGPEHVDTGGGRADHVTERDFDTSTLDKPGLELLGERQEAFLKHWADDWRGAKMKVLLSQTVFAGVATHHGSYNSFLLGDLDSGAWPQTARDRAVDLIRKSKALHISGDQHLTTLSQYGVHEQRDSNWSFCTPAISAGYPRWWRPDEEGIPHENRPMHDLPNTGEFVDGFGNLVYIYAVGNPIASKSKHRYERAHEKGSGFGYVLMDPETETFEIHSYRFLVDVTDGNPENEFPGWPVTLHADDNSGARRLFNGVNTEGWHGRPHFDPYQFDELSAEEQKAKIAQWNDEAEKHWSVENGELVNDGAGPYLTTNEEFEDYELQLEYKTVPEADSGIYLKGTPQVQIWDSTQEAKFSIGANLGSGGLWNNSEGNPGKNPLVLADRPFGEWNKVRVVQVGARTSVWLNDQQVVDSAIMENYWRRDQPLRRRGPIQLQTHGGEIRWRNITLQTLDTEAANAFLAQDDDTGFK